MSILFLQVWAWHPVCTVKYIIKYKFHEILCLCLSCGPRGVLDICCESSQHPKKNKIRNKHGNFKICQNLQYVKLQVILSYQIFFFCCTKWWRILPRHLYFISLRYCKSITRKFQVKLTLERYRLKTWIGGRKWYHSFRPVTIFET